MSILHKLSDTHFSKAEKESKEIGNTPDWWEGMTSLAASAVSEFEKDYETLQHHKDTTVGLWAMDTDPKKLLFKFWQQTSDACPLEVGEAEEQEKNFAEFVARFCFQIK